MTLQSGDRLGEVYETGKTRGGKRDGELEIGCLILFVLSLHITRIFKNYANDCIIAYDLYTLMPATIYCRVVTTNITNDNNNVAKRTRDKYHLTALR